jgi:16S rRNA (uracil1498-N3)-methyltransferase
LSRARFHVPEAAPGARITLPEHAAHHAREVLRLRSGAEVQVFDGLGSEFTAVLDEVSRARVSARLGPPVEARPESPLRIVLALSPLKGDRMELAIQKATELGVSAIWPVVTVRTDAVARPALKGSRQERWEKVASGAAEQCGRSVVPEIAPTVGLDALCARPFQGERFVLLERGAEAGLRTFPRSGSAMVLVGPAGGWDEGEVVRLREAGFAPVSLGPRILRAETAAVTAVAVLQALWGDLG